jgi:hypothetical protein
MAFLKERQHLGHHSLQMSGMLAFTNGSPVAGWQFWGQLALAESFGEMTGFLGGWGLGNDAVGPSDAVIGPLFEVVNCEQALKLIILVNATRSPEWAETALDGLELTEACESMMPSIRYEMALVRGDLQEADAIWDRTPKRSVLGAKGVVRHAQLALNQGQAQQAKDMLNGLCRQMSGETASNCASVLAEADRQLESAADK